MLRSRRTRRFRALLAALPLDVQRQARDAYHLFQTNPRHPSLRFKRVNPSDPSLYSARMGGHYRVIGKLKRRNNILRPPHTAVILGAVLPAATR